MTLKETAAALSRACDAEVTPSQVRTWLVLGQNARALTPKRQGDARLFTREDIGLALVLMNLRAQGASKTVTRLVVFNWRDEIVKAWRRGANVGPAVTGLNVEMCRREQAPRDAAWADLQDIWRTVERVSPSEG